MTRRIVAYAAALGLGVSLGLAACGGVSLDITCAQYLQKSAPDQRAVTLKYLNDVAGNKNPNSAVTLTTQTTLLAYCHIHPDQMISHISI
ncbi:MAG TPA: hypothetical protein VJT31_29305 [Rugosimonospora sp.]|nr:hypothetical protein [Rugosimonospora sp.]